MNLIFVARYPANGTASGSGHLEANTTQASRLCYVDAANAPSRCIKPAC
jgi:hypothetical protein